MAPRVNEALQGTSGTPSNTNRYVTNDDPRLAGGSSVTSVTATAPISSSGGTTPNITHDAAGTAGTYGSASAVPVVTTNATGHVTGVTSTPIQIAESQVTGLTSDLAGKVATSRQVIAGTGLSGGGALLADVTLSVDFAPSGVTSATQAVRADDSRLSGGAAAVAEIPSGTVNGSNVTFALSSSPSSSAGVILTLDGVTQRNGTDYTVSGTTITFVSAPATGSEIFAQYNVLATSAGAAGSAGGDLSGTYPNPTVAKVQGRAVASTAPATGQVFAWNGSAWAPAGLYARTAVTGATALSGAGNQFAEVTSISASFAITLPAASDGQAVVVADRTGTAGSGSYLVRVAAAVGETIRIPGVGACAGLYLCSDSAAFTLVGVGGVGWEVVSGSGYAVDPRLVSGLYLWLDARRGLTLASSRLVSTWADQSGNGRDFTQAVAANQPLLSRLPGSSSLPAIYADGTSSVMASGNLSLSSGACSVLTLLATPVPTASTTYRTLYGWDIAATTGLDLRLSAGGALEDWQQYDVMHLGNGLTAARAPRAIGHLGVSGAVPAAFGIQPHVVASRLSASAASLQVDGASLVSRVASAGAVIGVSAKPIYLLAPNSTPTSPFQGWMSAFLFFDAAISDADFAVLQADLLRQAGGR